MSLRGRFEWTGAALWLLLLAGSGTAEELRLANIFNDHMVLQREKPVRIWGWARPKTQVTVAITEDEKTAAPLLARKNRDRASTDRSAEYRVSISYVEENVPSFETLTRKVRADADGLWLAEFESQAASFRPKWILARSGTEEQILEDVLIGEVWICSGQSNMEWRNFHAREVEGPGAIYPGIRYADFDDSWYRPRDDLRRRASWQVCSPESVDRFSAVPYLFAMTVHRYLKAPVGVVCNARGGTLGQAWTSREALDGVESEIVRNVLQIYDQETARWESEESRIEILARHEEEVAKTRARHEREVELAAKEGEPKPRLRLPKKPEDPRSGWSPPAGLFNATVWPLRRMAIRGALYYQGENQNFGRWTQYQDTFPTIVPAWRTAFGAPDLPFGIITLPGWGRYDDDPEVACVADGYAIVRDVHSRTHAAAAHTGLITTYDVGNSYIHPGWKRPVGERAARWALARVYGQELRHRGPVFRSMEIEGGKAYLTFEPDPLVKRQLEEGKDRPWWLVVPVPREGEGADYRGFLVAGQDQRWYPARVRRNMKREALEVWSDLVPEPVAIRYGWAQWPTGNACCNQNLPVPTFRTDDWPIPEMAAYSPEVKKECDEEIAQLKKQAQVHALDRKIREASATLPLLEKELYYGRHIRDNKRFLDAKLERLDQILDECDDPEIQRAIGDSDAMKSALSEIRQAVAHLRQELNGS